MEKPITRNTRNTIKNSSSYQYKLYNKDKIKISSDKPTAQMFNMVNDIVTYSTP